MTLASPIAAVIVALLGLITCVCTRTDRATRARSVVGAILLALAAGEPTVSWMRPADVLVMVDASASTRGADYHIATQRDARVRLLVPGANVRTVLFSDSLAAATRWAPPAADAILLFSDGQFELPDSNPPTWPIIDPRLASAADAAVESIAVGDNQNAFARVRNTGNARTLKAGAEVHTLPTGGSAVVINGKSAATEVRLSPGDDWPENDALAIPPADRPELQRWWLGEHPPSGWRAAPQLMSLSGLASASVVAVDSSSRLSPTDQRLLTQYVTELGGSLLLIERSSHAQSAFLPLSPLAFEPPTPMHRWVLLIDSSGSMSQRDGPISRFEAGCNAVREMLDCLPSNDNLAIGAFARDLTWWLPTSTVAAGRTATWPPATVRPSGPTNLEPLLEQLLVGGSLDARSTLVVVTDSEAPIQSIARLGAAFQSARIALNAIAIDASNPALADLCTSTGGQMLSVTNLSEISMSAAQLVEKMLPSQSIQTSVQYVKALPIPPREPITLHPAWLREHASQLAWAGEQFPAAAEWQRGTGRVMTLAFAPTENELSSLADHLSRMPFDPRIAVTFEQNCLRIDASGLDDANDRHFALQLAENNPLPLNQIAPARYALTLTPSNQPRTATITLDGMVLRRTVIPPRYPAEFDAIGNNLANLQTIAARSGGRVIQPSDTQPIALPRSRRAFALASPLAACGAAAWLLAVFRRKL